MHGFCGIIDRERETRLFPLRRTGWMGIWMQHRHMRTPWLETAAPEWTFCGSMVIIMVWQVRGFNGRLSNPPANQPDSGHAAVMQAPGWRAASARVQDPIRCDISDNVQRV